MNIFYVYCHKNPLTNEIFYIGKGKDNRAYIDVKRGKYYNNYVKKHGKPIIEIIQNNLTECEALELEKNLINIIGRKDLKKGPLVNVTDGGEGVSGFTHSEETKNKIRIYRKGKPTNKGQTWVQINKRRKGIKKGSYNTRKDKGKKLNNDIKLKFSEGKRNKSIPIIQYNKQMVFIKEWRSAADIREQLNIKGIYNCLEGIVKTAGGFIWKYKDLRND